MKSSLKTFLAGENPFLRTIYKKGWLPNNEQPYFKLKGSKPEDQWFSNGIVQCLDVLDDGTAITYCPDK